MKKKGKNNRWIYISNQNYKQYFNYLKATPDEFGNFHTSVLSSIAI
jgi:hypothetical protein